MGRHNVSGMFSLPIMPSGMGKTCIISGVYIFPKNHILSLSPFQNDIFPPSKYCTDGGEIYFFLLLFIPFFAFFSSFLSPFIIFSPKFKTSLTPQWKIYILHNRKIATIYKLPIIKLSWEFSSEIKMFDLQAGLGSR